MNGPIRLPAEPFRFVDRMIELGEKGAGVAEKLVALDHPFLDSEGRLPDALLVEALAQAVAFSLASAPGAPDRPAAVGLLAGASEIDFLGRVQAPARLWLSVRHWRSFGSLATFEGEAHDGDRLLLRGRVTTASLPAPAPGLPTAGVLPLDRFESPRGPIQVLDRPAPGSPTRAEKLFTGRESYFAGHFPGDPIVPGTILLEAMDELCKRNLRRDAILRRVERVRFRRIVRPGERVVFEAAAPAPGNGGERVRFALRAFVDGELAADSALCYECPLS